MKKTIITVLIAACGAFAAQGETTLLADWNGFTDADSNGNYTNNGYTLNKGTASSVNEYGILSVDGGSSGPSVSLSSTTTYRRRHDFPAHAG